MVMAAQTVRWGRAPTPCCAIDDDWNRLVEVYTYVGGPPTTFGKYRYDGLHRRIWRIVDGFGYPNRTDYYYNTDWQVLEERFSTTTGSPATNVTCQYVWDPRYIDAPVCRDKDVDDDEDCTETDWNTGDDPDEHLYYCQDANFNTTALVERSDGTVVERYVYDPYGKVTIYDDDWSDTVTWANSKKNACLYCGYRYDHETRLYHVRHRSYHPTLGRWMQRDRIGYADGMSLYEYVRSSPIPRRDGMGLSSQDAWDGRVPKHTRMGTACLHNRPSYESAEQSAGQVFPVQDFMPKHVWKSGEVSPRGHKIFPDPFLQKANPVAKLAGWAGFIVGWDIKGKCVVTHKGSRCSCHESEWRFMPYIVLNDEGRNGSVRIHPGSSAIVSMTLEEHERAHAEGLTNEQLRTVAEAGFGFEPGAPIVGYVGGEKMVWTEAKFFGFLPVVTAPKAPNGKSWTDENCSRACWDVFEERLAHHKRLDKIARKGSYHWGAGGAVNFLRGTIEKNTP